MKLITFPRYSETKKERFFYLLSYLQYQVIRIFRRNKTPEYMRYIEQQNRLVQKRIGLLTELKEFMESEDDNRHFEMFNGIDLNGKLGFEFKFGEHHFAIIGKIGVLINAIIFETWMYVDDNESIYRYKKGLHLKELDFTLDSKCTSGRPRLISKEKHEYFEPDYCNELLRAIHRYELRWFSDGNVPS